MSRALAIPSLNGRDLGKFHADVATDEEQDQFRLLVKIGGRGMLKLDGLRLIDPATNEEFFRTRTRRVLHYSSADVLAFTVRPSSTVVLLSALAGLDDE